MKLRILLVVAWLLPTLALAADNNLQDRLRYRLDALDADSGQVSGQPLFAKQALLRFYQGHGYRPVWQAKATQVEALLKWIDTAAQHGLKPDDYHRATLNSLKAMPGADAAGLQLDRELLLSDAALMLSTHLLAGRINPKSLDAEWHADMRGGDVVAMLSSALQNDQLDEHFANLLPRAPGYQRLLSELARVRQQLEQPQATAIPSGPLLKPGHVGPRVALLRARLLPDAASSDVFDQALEHALSGYQQSVGLQADGIAGPQTLVMLNQTDKDLFDVIRVNLERWRWLPEDLGSRHILVNIPDFSLRARRAGVTELQMPVIVGRDYRRTPVFSANMRYLVLNPYWEVPHSIATKDLIPKFRANPASYKALGYELLRGWGAQQQAVDVKPEDWQRFSEKSFPYRLRQRPGPHNALGKVKFMMPNSFSVYLHDTAQPELFAQSARSLSSGCIRLSQPRALLSWVTQDQTAWPEHAQPVDQTVRLNAPLPVHIQYWTAWVDDKRVLQRRYDIYQRDAAVLQALNAPPDKP